MSDVQPFGVDGAHPLRDEPLPVRIPSGIFKYPREWCLNDGLPQPTEPIPYADITVMESSLYNFTYLSQGVLAHLIFSLSLGGPDIICNGHPIRFPKFFRFAKYGSKKDAMLQEAVLSMIKQAAEKKGFTLGEVKALFYIASLGNNSHGAMGEEEYEMEVVENCRAQLDMGQLSWMPAFKWGGDLKRFKPILEKALDYYEKVVIPEWCLDTGEA